MDSYPTRAGIFVYQNADGSTSRELRSPDEVFSTDSLATLALVPVVDNHPAVGVMGSSVAAVVRGVVGEGVRRDEDHVRASLTIFDGALIAKMKAGKAQLSCGYSATVVKESGMYHGQPYDAVQRNITYDHLAVVDVGRAGPSARARMDAAGIMIDGDSQEPQMTDLEKLEAAALAVTAQTKRADDAEAKLAEVVARADAADLALAALHASVDAAEKVRTDAGDPVALGVQVAELTTRLDAATLAVTAAEAPERLRSAVKSRVALEHAAMAVCGEKLDAAALSDRDLMLAVMAKLPGTVDATKSDEDLRVRCDAAVDGFLRGTKALAKIGEFFRTDAARAEPNAMNAREKMIERNRNASAAK